MSTSSPAHTPTMPQCSSRASAAIAIYTALAASIDHMRYAVSLAPMRMPSSAKTAPPSGCMSAKSGHSFAACASTAMDRS